MDKKRPDTDLGQNAVKMRENSLENTEKREKSE